MRQGNAPELERPTSRGHGAHRSTNSGPSWLARGLGALAALLLVVCVVGGLLFFRGQSAPDGVAFVPKSSGSAAPSPRSASPNPTPSSATKPSTHASAQASSAATRQSTAPTTSTDSAQAAAPPAQPAARPSITVLNNSTVSGLATRTAAQFRAEGWSISEIGNLTGRVPVTTVYYGSGEEQAARELAQQFPGIRDVEPRYAGLPGSGLTVVLTGDYE